MGAAAFPILGLNFGSGEAFTLLGCSGSNNPGPGTLRTGAGGGGVIPEVLVFLASGGGGIMVLLELFIQLAAAVGPAALLEDCPAGFSGGIALLCSGLCTVPRATLL